DRRLLRVLLVLEVRTRVVTRLTALVHVDVRAVLTVRNQAGDLELGGHSGLLRRQRHRCLRTGGHQLLVVADRCRVGLVVRQRALAAQRDLAGVGGLRLVVRGFLTACGQRRQQCGTRQNCTDLLHAGVLPDGGSASPSPTRPVDPFQLGNNPIGRTGGAHRGSARAPLETAAIVPWATATSRSSGSAAPWSNRE